MVLESAKQCLSVLAPIAQQLNAASDTFTNELRTIQEELEKLKLGVEVTLDEPLTVGDLTEDIDDEGVHAPIRCRVNQYLGYGRDVVGRWRLLVRTFREYEDFQGNVTNSVFTAARDLLDSSRELRMEAAKQIEDLLLTLGEEAKKRLDALQRVTDKASIHEAATRLAQAKTRAKSKPSRS